MDDDLKTIAVWWAGWTILDWIWKYFLGTTLLSLGGVAARLLSFVLDSKRSQGCGDRHFHHDGANDGIGVK